MGPFGASHYSLSFFIPFHPKLPPSDDGAVPPQAASLSDAWKGLGLTYILLKGLKKTSKTLKLIRDSADAYGNNNAGGSSGSSRSDKGVGRSISIKNPVGVRPVASPNSAGYGLRQKPRGSGQVSSHTRACKTDTFGMVRGERKGMSADLEESAAEQHAARSQAERRFSTEKSLREFGLGLEGVVTTIQGLSQQVDYKHEMKEIITVVKTADRVVEGVRAAKGVIQTFSSPFGDALLGLGVGNGVVLGVNTVKIVLKGVKISKGLVTVTKLCKNKQTGAIGAGAEMAIKSNENILGQRFKVIVKGLKASEGAANVVTISKEVGKTLAMFDRAEFFTWSVMMKGLKFTKSAIRVLEPLGSIPLISAVGKGILEIKGAVEGVGMVVKAVVLSKELYVVILKGVGLSRGGMAAFNEFKRRSSLFKGPQTPQATAQCVEHEIEEEEQYSQRSRVSYSDQIRLCKSGPSLMVVSSIRANSVSSGWEIHHIFSNDRSVDVGMDFSSGSDFFRTVKAVASSPPPFPVLSLAGCLYLNSSVDSSDPSQFRLYSNGGCVLRPWEPSF